MKPFPWRPGMLTTTGERVLVVHDDRLTFAGFGAPAKDYQPDQNDPATLGALLGAVEDAWAHLGVITIIPPVAASMGEPWRLRLTITLGDFWPIRSAPTRFDLLVAAWRGVP